MTKHWFKKKRFGWGFTPISWEGWVSTAVLIGIMLFTTLFKVSEGQLSTWEYYGFIVAIVVIFTFFAKSRSVD